MSASQLLIADPPWLTDDSLPGETRGAEKQYPCMTTAAICAMELPRLADACLLLLWRLACMQRDSLDVAEAWGFEVKSELVWQKLTKNGKKWFGMGHTVRASHETCLVCTRGGYKLPEQDRIIRSTFSAKVPLRPNGSYWHSAKPDEFYTIAEGLGQGPGVELFARKLRPGWTQFGNQLGMFELVNPAVDNARGDILR